MSVVSRYASLIETCASTKSLKTLTQLHARAIQLGISHHDFIRAKLLYSYASFNQIKEANLLFTFSNRKPTFLYNCMIRSYSSLNLHRDSLNFFHQMLLSDTPPDRHTFPSVLKSVAGISSLHLGRQIHAFIVTDPGLSSDPAITNSLISMYAKCGELGNARNVFDEMPERNVVTWGAITSGYSMHGAVSEVFALFEMMLEEFLPDEVVFTAVLTACRHAGETEKGLEFFRMMKEKYGVRARLEHYTCVVEMLGRDGRVEEVERLVREMEMEPDEVMWRVVLGACRVHKKMEVAERVAEMVYGKNGNTGLVIHIE